MYIWCTSLHIIDSISAVTFIISLCRSVTNTPVLHVNAWLMLYFALQTHLCGKHLNSHPYHNKTAKKSCLFKGCIRYIFASFFLSLNESTCETRKNVFYFTSKALFVLKKI